MPEKQQKKTGKEPKVLQITGDDYTPTPLIPKPRQIRNASGARRLMSEVLFRFQKNEISARAAKDLSYLIQIFLQTTRSSVEEEKFVELEKKVNRLLKEYGQQAK